jgi:hypothetical protein
MFDLPEASQRMFDLLDSEIYMHTPEYHQQLGPRNTRLATSPASSLSKRGKLKL